MLKLDLKQNEVQTFKYSRRNESLTWRLPGNFQRSNVATARWVVFVFIDPVRQISVSNWIKLRSQGGKLFVSVWLRPQFLDLPWSSSSTFSKLLCTSTLYSYGELGRVPEQSSLFLFNINPLRLMLLNGHSSTVVQVQVQSMWSSHCLLPQVRPVSPHLQRTGIERWAPDHRYSLLYSSIGRWVEGKPEKAKTRVQEVRSTSFLCVSFPANWGLSTTQRTYVPALIRNWGAYTDTDHQRLVSATSLIIDHLQLVSVQQILILQWLLLWSVSDVCMCAWFYLTRFKYHSLLALKQDYTFH